MDRRQHWDTVYSRKPVTELTWFQPDPVTSLSLIRETGIGPEARVLDVGGGASTLPSFLLDMGFTDLSVLDVSTEALDLARGRFGPKAREVQWIEADLLSFDPPVRWTLWHDRAVFHFLTTQDDRDAYLRALTKGLEPGGHLIIATFAPDGPSKCSGLDVVRYSPESLHSELGLGFELRGSVKEAHQTPSGGTQSFTYSWFQKAAKP